MVAVSAGKDATGTVPFSEKILHFLNVCDIKSASVGKRDKRDKNREVQTTRTKRGNLVNHHGVIIYCRNPARRNI